MFYTSLSAFPCIVSVEGIANTCLVALYKGVLCENVFYGQYNLPRKYSKRLKIQGCVAAFVCLFGLVCFVLFLGHHDVNVAMYLNVSTVELNVNKN